MRKYNIIFHDTKHLIALALLTEAAGNATTKALDRPCRGWVSEWHCILLRAY
jgi:hypothetical protein